MDDSNDGHGGLIIPPDNTHDEQRHAAGEDPYLDASNDVTTAQSFLLMQTTMKQQ